MSKEEVKQLTENSFEVLGRSVIFKKKPGRTSILCNCLNSTKYTDVNYCIHKKLVLEYLFTKKINEHLDKLIPVYENWVKCDLPINPELCLNDLRNLKRILK